LILLSEIGADLDQSLQKQAYVKSWLASILKNGDGLPSSELAMSPATSP